MDLSLATVEQMMEELHNRGLEFSLVVSHRVEGNSHPEQEQYELHSSLPDALHQSLHFLLGALSILGDAADGLQEKNDEHAEFFRRWQYTGETLLNDMLGTGHEWSDDEDEE